MKLSDIEAMSLRHTNGRLKALTRLKKDLESEGVRVKDISYNDLECFWVSSA